jgi:hypothetical protein
VIQAREYNSKVDIKKLVLTYDVTGGFTIELVETPKQVSTPQTPTIVTPA